MNIDGVNTRFNPRPDRDQVLARCRAVRKMRRPERSRGIRAEMRMQLAARYTAIIPEIAEAVCRKFAAPHVTEIDWTLTPYREIAEAEFLECGFDDAAGDYWEDQLSRGPTRDELAELLALHAATIELETVHSRKQLLQDSNIKAELLRVLNKKPDQGARDDVRRLIESVDTKEFVSPSLKQYISEQRSRLADAVKHDAPLTLGSPPSIRPAIVRNSFASLIG